MGVVRGLTECLQVPFEGVLVTIETSIDSVLNVLKAGKDVDSGLLIPGRGTSQVCRVTLKLQSLVPILYKARGNGGYEWCARQAGNHIACIEPVLV